MNVVTRVILSVLFLLMLSLTFNIESGAASESSSQAETVSKVEMAEPGKCLTPQETELVTLLNKVREENHLPPVPVKESLYKVAKWHVIDLSTNSPHKDRTDDRGMPCNIHSWSDKGKEKGGWNPLCYTADHKQALGMWKKPREISDHRSNGYENVYWTSAILSPAMAINYWTSRNDELDMIIEQNNWGKHPWRTMGVGMFGNYAAVWFSVKSTGEEEMKPCELSAK